LFVGAFCDKISFVGVAHLTRGGRSCLWVLHRSPRPVIVIDCNVLQCVAMWCSVLKLFPSPRPVIVYDCRMNQFPYKVNTILKPCMQAKFSLENLFLKNFRILVFGNDIERAQRGARIRPVLPAVWRGYGRIFPGRCSMCRGAL